MSRLPPARAFRSGRGRGAHAALLLARLHQTGVEQDRIELGVIRFPARSGRLGVARLHDEAGLLRLGLELGILQRRHDVGFQEAQPILGDALRTDDAAPGADDDVEPCSRNVGMSGAMKCRSVAETPRIFSLPALCCSTVSGTGTVAESTSPPIKPMTVGPKPA